MQYTVDYFIDYFSSIPGDKWCTHALVNDFGQSCANGHLMDEINKRSLVGKHGSTCITPLTSEKWKALHDILSPLEIHIVDEDSCSIEDVREDYSLKAVAINNRETAEYQQSTPKERILAALNDVKAQEAGLSNIKEMIEEEELELA